MPPGRHRLAEGIYADQWGIEVVVTINGDRRSDRFPLNYPLNELAAIRARMRADLLDEHAEAAKADGPVPVRGTFAGDLPRYLKLIEGRPSFKSDQSHLRAWLPAIGTTSRHRVRHSQIRETVAAWLSLDTPPSPKTIRHRVRVLREMYQGLDGAHARPPTTGLKLPKVPEPQPRPVPLAVIRRVAKSLRRGKRGMKAHSQKKTIAATKFAVTKEGYARFLVRATTGQRPSQIGRAEPNDLDWTRKIWWVRPAKGGRMIPFPLSPDSLKAWKYFAKVKAWGPFDARSFSLLLRRHGWPVGIRPYALRHTFAIDMLLKGASLEDVSGLLGHKQIETTRRHYAPVILSLLRKAAGRRRLNL